MSHFSRRPCLILLLAGALAGCGSSSSSSSIPSSGAQIAPGAPCPGASPCPYTSVRVIGRRGEGDLRKPEAIALGPHGEVYVGDQFSYVVQRFSASGRFETQWGSYGAGPGQLGSVDSLAVGADGDVYVVDSTHDRVERFTGDGRLLTAWGERGSAVGQFRFGAGDGPESPPGGGVAVYGGHVYVADTANGRIVRYSLDGTEPAVWGDPGPALAGSFSPRGIAVTAGAVYVADEGNRRVEMFDHSGRLLAQIGGFGRGAGRFSDPFDVAVGRGGDVFVVDDNNNRIVRLSGGLRWISAWRGEGGATLGYIRADAADAAGRVYVADTGRDRIEVFDPGGHELRRWGTPGDGSGQLVSPQAVAATADGGVLVAGVYGSRSPISSFGPDLSYRSSWTRGGHVVLGRHFFSPTALAVAPDGSVLVSDRQNGVVRRLGPTGAFRGALGVAAGVAASAEGAFRDPSGVAVDARGDVYVADTGADRVWKLSPGGRRLAVWGAAPAAGVSPAGPVGLREPTAVAVDAAGRVYVADSGHDRVVVLDRRGRQLAAWGGEGGAPGQFSYPDGIAVDARGRVFVADAGNDRIQELTSGGRVLAVWGVEGSAPGELLHPAGLAVVCGGELLVADMRNNRVQAFSGVAAAAPCGRS